MFLLDNGQVVLSASDLTAASACEFAVLRGLDARLGRVPGVEPAPHAMLERVAALGDQHEQAVLKGYVIQFGLFPNPAGAGVASVARPKAGGYGDAAALQTAHATTLEFLDSGADVVYQAGFFDGDVVDEALIKVHYLRCKDLGRTHRGRGHVGRTGYIWKRALHQFDICSPAESN